MNIKQIVEQPISFQPYSVELNITGEREVCTLTRGVWNIVDTGAFFAYECDAVAVGEVYACNICGRWAMYTSNNGCENCFSPIVPRIFS